MHSWAFHFVKQLWVAVRFPHCDSSWHTKEINTDRTATYSHMMKKHHMCKLGQVGSGSQELGTVGAPFPQSFRAQSQRLNTRSSAGNSAKGLAGEVGPNRSISKKEDLQRILGWGAALVSHRPQQITEAQNKKWFGKIPQTGWIWTCFKQFVIWSFKGPKIEWDLDSDMLLFELTLPTSCPLQL